MNNAPSHVTTDEARYTYCKETSNQPDIKYFAPNSQRADIQPLSTHGASGLFFPPCPKPKCEIRSPSVLAARFLLNGFVRWSWNGYNSRKERERERDRETERENDEVHFWRENPPPDPSCPFHPLVSRKSRERASGRREGE